MDFQDTTISGTGLDELDALFLCNKIYEHISELCMVLMISMPSVRLRRLTHFDVSNTSRSSTGRQGQICLAKCPEGTMIHPS